MEERARKERVSLSREKWRAYKGGGRAGVKRRAPAGALLFLSLPSFPVSLLALLFTPQSKKKKVEELLFLFFKGAFVEAEQKFSHTAVERNLGNSHTSPAAYDPRQENAQSTRWLQHWQQLLGEHCSTCLLKSICDGFTPCCSREDI